jgi:hypothetical protein
LSTTKRSLRLLKSARKLKHRSWLLSGTYSPHRILYFGLRFSRSILLFCARSHKSYRLKLAVNTLKSGIYKLLRSGLKSVSLKTGAKNSRKTVANALTIELTQTFTH